MREETSSLNGFDVNYAVFLSILVGAWQSFRCESIFKQSPLRHYHHKPLFNESTYIFYVTNKNLSAVGLGLPMNENITSRKEVIKEN